MAVYVTGDTHGNIDIHKLTTKNFPEQKDLTKDDILIILGDFGLIWDVNESGKDEQYWLDWLNDKPWTTYVILGNHENYDRLLEMPKIVDKYGNNLRQIHDSIFCMENGIHTIENKTFFTFRGGTSVDKWRRTPNVSWWPQEIPTNKDFDSALDEAKRVGKVDFVLTHAAPEYLLDSIFENVGFFHFKKEANCPVEQFLELIDDCLEFGDWYFGHYHDDKVIDKKHTLVYNKIYKII